MNYLAQGEEIKIEDLHVEESVISPAVITSTSAQPVTTANRPVTCLLYTSPSPRD